MSPPLTCSSKPTQPLRHVLAASALALAVAGPAHALAIVPTYDATVNTVARSVIDSVIAGYAATFVDPITVFVKFQNMATGLGQSNAYVYNGTSYTTYLAHLRADASSATDAAAMASVPNGLNPLTHNDLLDATRAQLGAVGIFIAPPVNDYDGTVSLNFGLMNLSRSGVIDPAKYDLQAVVQHEINEVLGTVSNVGDSSTVIRPIDLFRYSAPGVRSFGTPSDPAYFSINGGVTNLATYNSNSAGDSGDFNGAVVRVQNAFGTPGNFTVQMGVEITALDAVGFTLAPVPEPESWALMLAGLGALGTLARRRPH